MNIIIEEAYWVMVEIFFYRTSKIEQFWSIMCKIFNFNTVKLLHIGQYLGGHSKTLRVNKFPNTSAIV